MEVVNFKCGKWINLVLIIKDWLSGFQMLMGGGAGFHRQHGDRLSQHSSPPQIRKVG
jgi:hypothetical protein